jgi:hypothetical protein
MAAAPWAARQVVKAVGSKAVDKGRRAGGNKEPESIANDKVEMEHKRKAKEEQRLEEQRRLKEEKQRRLKE